MLQNIDNSQMKFMTNRISDQFKASTSQMIRLYDTLQKQGRQQASYEFACKQQYNQNPQNYKRQDLIQKLS
jgi:tRNA(Phe) wybutosine-synthesizing methylase Tyw3